MLRRSCAIAPSYKRYSAIEAEFGQERREVDAFGGRLGLVHEIFHGGVVPVQPCDFGLYDADVDGEFLPLALAVFSDEFVASGVLRLFPHSVVADFLGHVDAGEVCFYPRGRLLGVCYLLA